MISKLQRAALGMALVISGAGCFAQMRADLPLRTTELHRESAPAEGSRCLAVFLPGVGDDARQFIQHDFAGVLARKRDACDAVVASAHIGHMVNGVVAERIVQDVLLPAWEDGYRHIWLVGVSIGGLNSLMVLREFPHRIRGVVLIAPFLGRRNLTDEIAADGGLRRWPGLEAGVRPTSLRARLGRIWSWLRDAVDDPDLPPIYIGFGRNDRYAHGHRQLARAMQPHRSIAVPGRHDWRTWRRVWSRLSARIDWTGTRRG